MCAAIASGSLPISIWPLLSSSRLIALPKANGDIRPIAIGETQRRVTARAICFQKRKEFADYFTPLQRGVSVEGGAELLVQQVQLLMEKYEDWILLKTDLKNAFNLVSRSHLLNQVLITFPDIYNHAALVYSDINPLIYLQRSHLVILSSQDGVHQGDPLGPALFSIAMQLILEDLQSHNTEVTILAYLDDVYLLGSPDRVFHVFERLRSAFSDINLMIEEKKCEIYCSSSPLLSTISQSTSIPATSQGCRILGTPIGSSSYIIESCADVAQSGSNLCGKLLQLQDPQCGMLLLRYCHVTRMNFLSRTVQPRLLESAAAIHDTLTRSTFTNLLGRGNLTDRQWLQATLPIRHGGFGLTALTYIAPFAFLSSWASTLHTITKQIPDAERLLDEVQNSHHSIVPSAEICAIFCFKTKLS